MEDKQRLIDIVLQSVNDMAQQVRGVRDIDDHFDTFDHLGITINLHDECVDEDWESLAIKLLLYLNKRLPNGNSPISWSLSFWRDLQQIGLFFAGDNLSDNCADAIVRKRSP